MISAEVYNIIATYGIFVGLSKHTHYANGALVHAYPAFIPPVQLFIDFGYAHFTQKTTYM